MIDTQLPHFRQIHCIPCTRSCRACVLESWKAAGNVYYFPLSLSLNLVQSNASSAKIQSRSLGLDMVCDLYGATTHRGDILILWR